MRSPLEYPIHGSGPAVHRLAKRWFAASIVGSVGMLLVPFLVCNASAQAGSPAAHINVPAPTGSVAPQTGSVAPPTGALGYGEFGPYGSVQSPGVLHSPMNPPASPNRHHHPPNSPAAGLAYYPYFYPVAVPYADDTTGDQTADQADDAEAQDAPSGLGWGAQDASARPIYNGPMRPYDPQQQDAPVTQATDLPREAPPTPTTLVFKDGHQLEVENYAIVGQTLYDLTPGHARKVALASLDLEATAKQNDDRGVIFQLPLSPLGNER